MRKSKSTKASKQGCDPVVDLATQLLVLWDADDASQHEYYGSDTVSENIKDDTMHQFGEWRDAVETIISFTQAKNLQGALVQLALACDAAHDVEGATEAGDKKTINRLVIQLERLIHSAIQAVRTAIPEINPDVVSVVKIYSGDYDHRSPAWIDHVGDWAEKGSALRASDGG